MKSHVRCLVVGWSVHLTYELQRRMDGKRRGSLPPTAFRPKISKSLATEHDFEFATDVYTVN